MERDAVIERLDVLIHLNALGFLPEADPKHRARLLRDAGVDVGFLSKLTGLSTTSIHALGVSGRKARPASGKTTSSSRRPRSKR